MNLHEMLPRDTPIEVNEKQYRAIMNDCRGTCAGREAEGKFYIKLWDCSERKFIRQVLNLNQ